MIPDCSLGFSAFSALPAFAHIARGARRFLENVRNPVPQRDHEQALTAGETIFYRFLPILSRANLAVLKIRPDKL